MTATSPLSTATLGESDITATRLIYGCMRTVGTWDPAAVTPEHEATAKAAVRTAIDVGYTHFDHADIYGRGQCERVFGDLLRESPHLRENMIITTKCGIRFAGDPTPDATHRYDFSSEHITWSCEQSLKRLNIDTIDIYLLHRPDLLMDPLEIADAFTRLHDQGKVRYFGVSNFTNEQFDHLQAALDQPLLCNQIEVHPARLDPIEDGTLNHLHRLGVTPTAWSPLAGGRFGNDAAVKANAPDREHQQSLLDALDAEANAHSVSRTAITLAWLMHHPAGIQPIVGSRNPDRIRDAATADRVTMSREVWYRIYLAARGKALP
ncbi:aldo/keto reductase family oxidoreductase [Phycisphaerales bacterium AB-hyl4]|uniref:Aldo/keto reductase family oxidoreductase n=1 Tax=Natronomicrosphaera hydrolytica TaxID=3242702 RepID=A0ABV4UC20_9BACT